MEALDGGVLERATRAFDLAVGPGMTRPGQTMVDAVLRAGIFEGLRAELRVVVHGVAEACGR